jgi:hypothetical protein
MGITREETLLHWNFFLALEEDLETLSKYIDFSANDDVYSIEIARLFLNTCSEVDVILKQLCKAINNESNAGSITAYFNEISAVFPQFLDFKVTIPRLGLTLTPWIDWSQDHPTFWWQHHNKVKHHRHENFDKANLKNCLNAVAGLYIAVLYLYQQQAESGDLLQLPKLFNVADEHFGGTKMGRYGHLFIYLLS